MEILPKPKFSYAYIIPPNKEIPNFLLHQYVSNPNKSHQQHCIIVSSSTHPYNKRDKKYYNHPEDTSYHPNFNHFIEKKNIVSYTNSIFSLQNISTQLATK